MFLLKLYLVCPMSSFSHWGVNVLVGSKVTARLLIAFKGNKF